MQVKKFEAPTIQEALETIKRELGPEAIILQTKKNKRGFGLMSKSSVEVTAAVSERAIQKKQVTERRLNDSGKEAVKKLSAEKQAELIDKFSDSHLQRAMKTKDQVQIRRQAPAPMQAPVARPAPSASAAPMAAAAQTHKKITATRYIDIDTPALQTQIGPDGNAHVVARPAAQPASGISGMSLEEEVRHLKRMLEEVKSSQDQNIGLSGSGAQALVSQTALSTGALQNAFEQMVINGIDKRFALALIRKVGFELGAESSNHPDHVLDQLAAEIMETTEVLPATAMIPEKTTGPVVISLVGPTGVGKTTTLAKIASEALIKRKLKVGLINVDSYKIAAFDQLGTYAKILNVPFRSVATAEDLMAAYGDFQNLDVILVDTTGRSQKDPESLKEMHGMLQCLPNNRVELVLSATTRDAELYDMATRFSIFRPQGIIMSKLDEATIYGSIYNVSQKVKLPLLYFTTGQRVPEDLEEATRERLVALVLDL